MRLSGVVYITGQTIPTQSEIEILNAKVPEAAERLSQEVVAFVQKLRDETFLKSQVLQKLSIV